MEYFRNEARTLARLVHPNIVRVFDFGIENRTPYLVMDYAPNGTLRQRHPRGTIVPLPTIVSYVKQIADALQYAHDEKYIHRDIKPENMLIGRRNEILLSDFGIAIVAQSSRLQSTQEVIGTVSYMAPEQIQAHPRPASDQYSLGIIVYEWLSGSVPFSGSFTEVAVKHTVAPVPPLRERVPTISPDIEMVVMTALQKDPHSRFGTVSAFANAFEQASQPNQSSQSQTVVPTIMPTAEPTVYRSNQLPNSVPPVISPPISTEPVGPAQPIAPITGNSPVMTPPTPQTVFQPPMSGVSLNNSAPVSTRVALPNTTGVKTKKRYKPLIDYLLPAKNQSGGARFGRDALLVIAFSVIFILWTHLFVRVLDIQYPSSLYYASLDVLFVMFTGAILGKWRGVLVVLVYAVAAMINLTSYFGVTI